MAAKAIPVLPEDGSTIVCPGRMPAGSVNAPHWYDLSNLATKRFDVENHVDAFTGRPLRGEAEVREQLHPGAGVRERPWPSRSEVPR